MEWDINNFAAWHLNIANVSVEGKYKYMICQEASLLIKERLEYDDLVTFLDKTHEGTQHTWQSSANIILPTLE